MSLIKDIFVFYKDQYQRGHMKKDQSKLKPLVYSCSGCSSAAQMANYLALQIDRCGAAEMSCIAGVGGNVKKLVNTALSGRKIVVIDGCPLACSKGCLMNHSLEPDLHIELTNFGVSKRNHEEFNKSEADQLLVSILHQIEGISC